MSGYKYRHLADRLRNEIEVGIRAPGTQIPTEEELAIRYSLGRNTVRQAIRLLVERGYLVRIQGSGTYVSSSVQTSPNSSQPVDSRSIGVVLPRCSNYIYPEVLMGISECLFEHDYTMVYRITYNKIDRERQVLTELLSTNIYGLIIEPTRSGWPLINADLYRRIEAKLPCVLTHATLSGFSFPTIGVSDYEGVAMLVDHLAANGHRRIAGFFKSDEQTGVRRFHGYAGGLSRNGIHLDENNLLWYFDEEFPALFSAAGSQRVLRALEGCTAVVCYNDETAGRLYPFLQARHIRVPEDISIVGYDDTPDPSGMQSFTTIDNPKTILGRAAVEALLRLMKNPAEDVSLQFPPTLIARDTVRNLAEALV
ncbi:MAG: GntR family transcriptional regulator [Planctomycetaceae bacterium]|nr:GntR family transcriptional regulator [Planctomycetaceae bacterium]